MPKGLTKYVAEDKITVTDETVIKEKSRRTLQILCHFEESHKMNFGYLSTLRVSSLIFCM